MTESSLCTCCSVQVLACTKPYLRGRFALSSRGSQSTPPPVTQAPTRRTYSDDTVAMADPIDPRLFSSSLPPQSQSYTAAPQHNAGHPYYLSAQQQPPQLQTAPQALDPALDQTSPTGPEASQDEDEQDDGDHDDHATPGSAKSPGDIKRARACDSCRGLKVHHCSLRQ